MAILKSTSLTNQEIQDQLKTQIEGRLNLQFNQMLSNYKSIVALLQKSDNLEDAPSTLERAEADRLLACVKDCLNLMRPGTI